MRNYLFTKIKVVYNYKKVCERQKYRYNVNNVNFRKSVIINENLFLQEFERYLD